MSDGLDPARGCVFGVLVGVLGIWLPIVIVLLVGWLL